METLTIEQIHQEWYTAAERLSQSFSEQKLSTVNEKLNRLRKIGFGITKDNDNLNDLHDAERTKGMIEKYALSYPMNKVISKRDVNKLCLKYNLVYGALNRFMGFVPDKNLKEIENFYHKDLKTYQVGIEINGVMRDAVDYFTEVSAVSAMEELIKSEHLRISEEINRRTLGSMYFPRMLDRDFREPKMKMKGSFLIAAPKKDMDISNTEQQGFEIKDKVHVPDPVVLFPIENGNYFLIVTAWGDEASDEIVVNPVHN